MIDETFEKPKLKISNRIGSIFLRFSLQEKVSTYGYFGPVDFVAQIGGLIFVVYLVIS